MTQDTIPPYRFEVVKYVSAISGNDTIYKFETVPVYLDYIPVARVKKQYTEEIPAQKTAFDYIEPCQPPTFNTEKPMAEKLSYLLEKSVQAAPKYPLNGEVQGAALSFAIIAFFVLAFKIHLLYANFCRNYHP